MYILKAKQKNRDLIKPHEFTFLYNGKYNKGVWDYTKKAFILPDGEAYLKNGQIILNNPHGKKIGTKPKGKWWHLNALSYDVPIYEPVEQRIYVSRKETDRLAKFLKLEKPDESEYLSQS